MAHISHTENIQVTVHSTPDFVDASCMTPCDCFLLGYAFFAYNSEQTERAHREQTEISVHMNMLHNIEMDYLMCVFCITRSYKVHKQNVKLVLHYV